MHPITALSLAVFLAPTLAAAQSGQTPAQQNIARLAVARAGGFHAMAMTFIPFYRAAFQMDRASQEDRRMTSVKTLQPSARAAAEAVGCRIVPGDQVAFTGRPTKHMKDLRRLAPPEKVRAIEVTDMWIVKKGRYKGQVACRLEIHEWHGSVVGTSIRASNLRRLMPY